MLYYLWKTSIEFYVCLFKTKGKDTILYFYFMVQKESVTILQTIRGD